MSAFANQASSPAVEIDSLLLAAAHEHGPVDFIGAWAELDRLAGELRNRLGDREGLEARADALIELLRRERFRVARRISPEDALFDAVLRRREGHPLLIASICAAVGRRAELHVCPISSGDDTLIGLCHGERSLAIDPAGECASPLRHPSWLCPHEVAFLALGELARLFALHGRITDAIRAAQLRSELPISVQLRESVQFEARALQAQLN